MNQKTWLFLLIIFLFRDFGVQIDLQELVIPPAVAATSDRPLSLEAEGKQLYQQGQYRLAIKIWQQAANEFVVKQDLLGQARILSNLALAYQQLGEWETAQAKVRASLAILDSTNNFPVLAQALNTQGTLLLGQGKLRSALVSWEQAEEAYAKAQDRIGIIRAQINQAQALQSLGLYHRGIKILQTAEDSWQELCPELECQVNLNQLKAVGWERLGNIYSLIGELESAERVLQKSLSIAQYLQSPPDIAAVYFSLGNLARIGQDGQQALAYYQQAARQATTPIEQTASQLAQLSLYVQLQDWQGALKLVSPLQSQLSQLPSNYTTIHQKINLASNLIRLKKAANLQEIQGEIRPSWPEIATLLATTAQKARQLGIERGQSYALGKLAQVYEQTQQPDLAIQLTEQALALANSSGTAEIAYLWSWQLGRMLAAQGESARAIDYYLESVQTLQSLSNDLVAINPDVQFSFQDSVEPVYRQLVDLLLQPSQDTISQERLLKALETIESLQLAELNNFFREACLEAQGVRIDEIDDGAAVIYPLILDDRLEIILSLPHQPLRRYSQTVPAQKVESVIKQLRKSLVIRSRRQFSAPAQQLYDWLIRPLEEDLAASGAKTIVFVPDGTLRNIPLSSLYDGEQFLIAKYAVAVTPGLQLLSPRGIQKEKLKALVAGLTEAREGFSSLQYVGSELAEIQQQVPTVVLLDNTFTKNKLQEEIEFKNFPVVHIATHGQFSSRLADTFLVAWDQRITIEQLDQILATRDINTTEAIELLVLSACETAAGDKRAALGLAGIAVKAGARSTIATLWSVNDQGTAKFMSHFYEQLQQNDISKAEALRRAQLAMLEDSWYSHPFYWSPFLLVGNWL